MCYLLIVFAELACLLSVLDVAVSTILCDGDRAEQRNRDRR